MRNPLYSIVPYVKQPFGRIHFKIIGKQFHIALNNPGLGHDIQAHYSRSIISTSATFINFLQCPKAFQKIKMP